MTNNTKQSTFSVEFPHDKMLSKVPEVTLYFWIIKILCTTVGETASDFLNVDLGFGLPGTAGFMGAVLLVVLFFQFREKRYIPGIYWLAVVLISIFGTLITDILTDSLKCPLEASTAIFSVALALTFAMWYVKEGTLSIHTIFTRRRESFYWLAILFTFALGTATGDLMAESLGFGYLTTGIIVCGCLFAVAIGWRLKLDAILSFWSAYILTRPLGASFGDYLSQSQSNGGLGLGASITSAIFLIAILAIVIFLSLTRRDFITAPTKRPGTEIKHTGVVWQIAVVVALVILTAGPGYYWRSSELHNQAMANTASDAPLGDLSPFRRIAEDTLIFVHAGEMSQAKSRVDDLEIAWDNAGARLRSMDPAKWSSLDDSIDIVLRNLRAVRQDATKCGSSLQSLIAVLDDFDSHGKAGIKPD